jgi:hypothetical protein
LKFLKGEGKVTFFSLEGKVVLEEQVFNLVTSVDVSSLNRGDYILQLKTDGGVVNQKIIKGF